MASPKKVMIGFKTDPEIKEKLEAMAYAEDRSVSYIVNRIIAKELSEVQKPEQVIEYINGLSFTSYADFLRKVIEDNKYSWIKRDLGEMQAYFLVCDRLGVVPDPAQIESFCLEEES